MGIRSHLLNGLDEIRASYWFPPALMAVLAVLLSMATLAVDENQLISPDSFPFLFNNQPEGARAVLTTIAGGMITVAGVVFSITLVTVSNAANQFGPRLLTHFMRDRANQLTLGTFTATFLYCVFILRGVRGGNGNDLDPLVPHLALLVGIGLAIASIAVLIAFIHHVPKSIHISNVTARIGSELLEQMKRRFPASVGADGVCSHDQPPPPNAAVVRLEGEGPRVTICSKKSGYLRIVDTETLMKLTTKADLLIRLDKEPGDFVIEGEAIVSVLPEAAVVAKDHEDALRGCFVLGAERTPAQDTRFLVQELVEIAGRALSPGINDPVTAISCLNWLAAAYASLVDREDPSNVRLDENEVPRIVALSLTFDRLVAEGFGSIRPIVATNAMAATAFLDHCTHLGRLLSAPRADVMVSEADALKTHMDELLNGSIKQFVLSRAQPAHESDP